ncbi:MAG: Lrp/AsnC family transcriptional regulator [Thiolinea sp.]
MNISHQDQQILQRLQHNCRQPIAEIGEQIGMSTSACHRRIKQLEKTGVIAGYTAQIDAHKLGYNIDILVEISLSSQSEHSLQDFEKAIEQKPEILECHLMAGEADYILRMTAKDLQHYAQLHRDVILCLPGVARVKSNIVLRSVKRSRGFTV